MKTLRVQHPRVGARPRRRLRRRHGPAIQGQGGDNHTYKVACALIIDFDLPHEDALDLIRAWNSSCVPPWSDRDLVQKLRSADRSGTHERGGKLRERPARPDPDDVYDVAIYVAFTLAPGNEVQGWLKAFDAALPWGGPMRSVPSVERQAALLLALHAPGRVERGPDRVPWIMKQAAREHFASKPPTGAARAEISYHHGAFEALVTPEARDGNACSRTPQNDSEPAAKTAARVHPQAPFPDDPETLAAREEALARFRSTLTPLEQRIFDQPFSDSEAAVALRAGTTAKTVHSTRNRIRKKAREWGLATEETNELGGVVIPGSLETDAEREAA